jgi:hypothetical protein
MKKEDIKAIFDANPDVDKVYAVGNQPFTIEVHAKNYAVSLNTRANNTDAKVVTHQREADKKAASVPPAA